jgi:predicted transcriptional regulator
MKRESTFNFRLPKALKTRLDAFCESRGMSKADLAVAAITEFLDSVQNIEKAHLIGRIYPVQDVEALRPAEKPHQPSTQRAAGA